MVAPFAPPPSSEFQLSISDFELEYVRSAPPSMAKLFVDPMLNPSDLRPTGLIHTALLVPRHDHDASVIWTIRITICH
jgi:hypothetical protein